ncbi:MAG: hypothetical protein E7355_01150 [Clostridiales bacterium]|nr:hypothetical protein [Clostridiales bacterium]
MDDTTTQTEEDALKSALSVVNIAEKKARIYSRLLTDTSLAKAMEQLACRHEEQKISLQTLLYGDKKNKKKGEKAEEDDET